MILLNRRKFTMESVENLQKKNNPQLISVVIENNEDGYLARIPGIQGAFAEGDTLEDAMFNCVDVFKMIIDYKKEEDKPIWKL